MTTTINVDINKGLDMTEEEKEAFVQIMDMNIDYGLCDFISEQELCLYQAILQEREENNK